MSDYLTLYIEPTNGDFANLYRDAADAYNAVPLNERDSGFDLFVDRASTKALRPSTVLVGQGCRAMATDAQGRGRAYWLTPRSSISKSGYRLANSMGLIDSGYRGVLMAALDDDGTVESLPDRIVQLASPSLLPWGRVVVVDKLPSASTARGEGGFGSTG